MAEWPICCSCSMAFSASAACADAQSGLPKLMAMKKWLTRSEVPVLESGDEGGVQQARLPHNIHWHPRYIRSKKSNRYERNRYIILRKAVDEGCWTRVDPFEAELGRSGEEWVTWAEGVRVATHVDGTTWGR